MRFKGGGSKGKVYGWAWPDPYFLVWTCFEKIDERAGGSGRKLRKGKGRRWATRG